MKALSRHGSRTARLPSGDSFFKSLTICFTLIALSIFAILIIKLIEGSMLSFENFGINFLFSVEWDYLMQRYGALPFIYGTLVSSAIALAIGIPLSLGIAIYLAEIAPRTLRTILSTIMELIAALPSVIIGLWGLTILAPIMRDVGAFLETYLGFLPIFKGPSYGLSMLTGGVVLAIMIIPIISSISREALLATPNDLKEAAISLGATRWEVIRMVMIPYAKIGIVGAIILGLGRAVGETMAIAMVIGNSPTISASLLAPAYTMTAVIANEFAEALDALHTSVLMEIALVLFLTSLAINILARILVWKVRIRG